MLNLGQPLTAADLEPPPNTWVVDEHDRLWVRSDAWDCQWFADGDDTTPLTWADIVTGGPVRPVIERDCPRGCGPMVYREYHDHDEPRSYCHTQNACQTCSHRQTAVIRCGGGGDD